MVNLFFPLAFFLLSLCLSGVVVAFLFLDNARDLVLWTQKVLGIWFGVFGIVFGGMLLLLLGLIITGRISLSPSMTDLVPVLSLLIWNIAFTVVSVAGAYFLLFLWSAEAHADASGIVRRLAFGEDIVSRDKISLIVEVVYLYTVTKDIRELRTKSFFVLVRHGRGRLSRYALYRPPNRLAEDEFRESVKSFAPLSSTTIPGLPRLPQISFNILGKSNNGDGAGHEE